MAPIKTHKRKNLLSKCPYKPIQCLNLIDISNLLYISSNYIHVKQIKNTISSYYNYSLIHKKNDTKKLPRFFETYIIQYL